MKPNDHGLTVDEQIALEAGELPAMKHLGTDKVGLEDRANMVENLSCVAANTRVWLLMEPAAATLYEASTACNERAGESGHPLTLLGNLLTLDALIASPAATQAMLRCLRRELVACVPELALMAQEVPVAAPASADLAGSRSHSIDSYGFFLESDGELLIERAAIKHPHSKPFSGGTLEPEHTFALLTFLRIPGVAGLIERAAAEREQRMHIEFEADSETIAAREEEAREQAYQLVLSDPILRGRANRELLAAAIATLNEREASN